MNIGLASSSFKDPFGILPPKPSKPVVKKPSKPIAPKPDTIIPKPDQSIVYTKPSPQSNDFVEPDDPWWEIYTYKPPSRPTVEHHSVMSDVNPTVDTHQSEQSMDSNTQLVLIGGLILLILLK